MEPDQQPDSQLGLLTQRRLGWGTGLIDVAGVGELLLACRRP